MTEDGLLRTPVGLALSGIVLGGVLCLAYAVAKIALDSRTIGR